MFNFNIAIASGWMLPPWQVSQGNRCPSQLPLRPLADDAARR